MTSVAEPTHVQTSPSEALAKTKPTQETALVKATPTLPSSFINPKTFTEAMQVAGALARSQLIPKHFQGNPADVVIAWQLGAELGLQPMQALQSIAVINGMPCIYGDGMLGVVTAHPDFIDISWRFDTTKDDGLTCYCTVERKGRKPKTKSFSIRQAKAAGLTGKKGPWQQYPERMLEWRATSWACRAQFPDALKGIRSYEEHAYIEQVFEEAGELPVGASLDDVLGRIAAATEEHHLQAVLVAAASLSPDDKTKAKAAYKSKVSELRGTFETGKSSAAPAKPEPKPEPKAETQPPPEPEPENDKHNYGPPPMEHDPETGEVLPEVDF